MDGVVKSLRVLDLIIFHSVVNNVRCLHDTHAATLCSYDFYLLTRACNVVLIRCELPSGCRISGALDYFQGGLARTYLRVYMRAASYYCSLVPLFENFKATTKSVANCFEPRCVNVDYFQSVY